MNDLPLADLPLAVAAASLHLPGRGWGVLVPGGFVLTVAHLVFSKEKPVTWIGANPNIDKPTFRASTNEMFELGVWFVDPISDMAILSAEMIATVEPLTVRLSEEPLPAGTPIFGHDKDGEWTAGQVEIDLPEYPFIASTWERKLRGGSSGRPVVTAAGELIGMHRSSSDGGDGGNSRETPVRALPLWALRRIAEAQQGDIWPLPSSKG